MLRPVAYMIQLAYEPAFDPFHTAFRLLRQADTKELPRGRIERVKILDVFMAEPRRCLKIRVPQKFKKSAAKAAACQPPTYGRRPTTNALYNRMSPMQDAALQTLVLHGLLDADAFAEGWVLRTEFDLSEALQRRITSVDIAQADLTSFLFSELNSIPLDGANGLKDRTGIGEYRYDIV